MTFISLQTTLIKASISLTFVEALFYLFFLYHDVEDIEVPEHYFPLMTIPNSFQKLFDHVLSSKLWLKAFIAQFIKKRPILKIFNYNIIPIWALIMAKQANKTIVAQS